MGDNMANSVDPARVIQKLQIALSNVQVELAMTQVALEDAKSGNEANVGIAPEPDGQ